MNSVRVPKGSCWSTDWYNACAAGQKKNISVTPICGATSAYGIQRERKTARSSMVPTVISWPRFHRIRSRRKCSLQLLFVGFLELLDLLVAAFHGVIECLLRCLLAAPDSLELLIDDIANLHEIAKAHAFGIGGRRFIGQFLDGDIGAGVLFIEALRLGQVVCRQSNRYIAGLLMPVGLYLRRGQESEELGYALVDIRVLLRQHPQRRAPDNRVLGRALHVGVVGKLGDAPVEFRVGLDIGVRAAGGGDNAAVAAGELRQRFILSPSVGEKALFRPVAEILNVAHLHRAIERQPGVEPAETVLLGPER